MTGQHSRRLAARMSVALLLAGGACVHRTGTVEPASLIFINEAPEAADVFAIVPSVSSVRLGTVMQGERRELVIPSRVIRIGSTVNIVARLFSRGTQASSGPVSIPSGGILQVTLPVGGTQLIVETGRR